jgi:hypothetical protein
MSAKVEIKISSNKTAMNMAIAERQAPNQEIMIWRENTVPCDLKNSKETEFNFTNLKL